MKNLNRSLILISVSLFLFVISFLVVLWFWKIKANQRVAIEINVDPDKNLSFRTNSALYYKITKNNLVHIDKIYSNINKEIDLKIVNIKNIEKDLFEYTLSKNHNLKITKNTVITAFLVFKKEINFFELFFN
ncbi:MAG1140 family protein [Mycoplasma procyoni]|uniref:MAG1140 family protein n=1 Tax=Mycoplasma procyoni TaxID=568784 RepID=UPI00197C7AD4|nr:hypothetical protein [Mycoplasma procyoni]MBN3535104.1 hypothetical protein [Mycoplasma procyoni]